MPAVRRLDVRVPRSLPEALQLQYTLKADLERLRIPPPRAPRWTQQLWTHTCFEAFIRIGDMAAYHEFNFSPSGEWAAYAFERYREGRPLHEAALHPGIRTEVSGDVLRLEATVRLDRLSPQHVRAALALGLSAVIEDADGALSYWALAHPTGKPDFHHAAAFALELK